MDWKRLMPYCTLLAVVFSSTLVLWLPFLFKANGVLGFNLANNSLLQVYKQFDGPLYIIPAKSLYDPKGMNLGDGSLPQKAIYYAAHLPLYPLLIRLLSVVGYVRSTILVNIIATVLLAWFFYYVLKKLHITGHPLLLSAVLLFLPRFLVLRGTGAPESLFLLLILVSLYAFEKEQFLLSGLAGALATMTKLPGILLFAAYVVTIIEKAIKTKKVSVSWVWILLIPAGLLGVFAWYALSYGDFFAYFHTGATVPMPYPFSVFDFQAKWVGTAWLEDVLFYLFFYGMAVYQLRHTKFRSFYYFALVFLAGLTFVQHRDISRYSLPLWPLSLIAFEHFFTSRGVRIIGGIALLAIYLYAWNFLLYNTMPITQWNVFM